MNPIQAIVSRRSVARLTAPAPADHELMLLVEKAATAPDHGLLRPWRLIVIRGEARRIVGSALAADTGDDRDAGKPLRAPLLVTIVFQPQAGRKVAEWEQLAATSAMVQNLSLLLHIRGWGSIWRTGPHLDKPAIREALGLAESERLLGWLYIGTPEPHQRVVRRPSMDVRTRVSSLDETLDQSLDQSGARS
ncbi:nitroreductase family protein [Acrocarpospora catenulata]|uniref:nitroreductase family protein n=1 Tax=Acrocarpospora catenulata TaxID=2836182 RepID=UPI001BDA9704|nr:nitroreductase [Acrocarpospora catenulata]